jgi:DNA segregation ATPase FtsK/SpoIIIE-like protein
MKENNRSISVGWTRVKGQRVMLNLPVADITSKHALVTGRTGVGKTASEMGIALELLTKHPETRLVLLDCKGEFADSMLE